MKTLGKLWRLLSGAREGLRREEMDGAHFATLGDRPFVGCRPCAPEPRRLDPPADLAPKATDRPVADND
ncbi:MAG: hypothetical protein QNJ30_15980 [Kiloniellales bacterium]|nr:hypothetical protein [Kiloniellales bacterium]